MPEDSQEAPKPYEKDLEKILGETGKEWEEMNEEEKLEKLEDL